MPFLSNLLPPPWVPIPVPTSAPAMAEQYEEPTSSPLRPYRPLPPIAEDDDEDDAAKQQPTRTPSPSAPIPTPPTAGRQSAVREWLHCETPRTPVGSIQREQEVETKSETESPHTLVDSITEAGSEAESYVTPLPRSGPSIAQIVSEQIEKGLAAARFRSSQLPLELIDKKRLSFDKELVDYSVIQGSPKARAVLSEVEKQNRVTHENLIANLYESHAGATGLNADFEEWRKDFWERESLSGSSPNVVKKKQGKYDTSLALRTIERSESRRPREYSKSSSVKAGKASEARSKGKHKEGDSVDVLSKAKEKRQVYGTSGWSGDLGDRDTWAPVVDDLAAFFASSDIFEGRMETDQEGTEPAKESAKSEKTTKPPPAAKTKKPKVTVHLRGGGSEERFLQVPGGGSGNSDRTPSARNSWRSSCASSIQSWENPREQDSDDEVTGRFSHILSQFPTPVQTPVQTPVHTPRPSRPARSSAATTVNKPLPPRPPRSPEGRSDVTVVPRRSHSPDWEDQLNIPRHRQDGRRAAPPPSSVSSSPSIIRGYGLDSRFDQGGRGSSSPRLYSGFTTPTSIARRARRDDADSYAGSDGSSMITSSSYDGESRFSSSTVTGSLRRHRLDPERTRRQLEALAVEKARSKRQEREALAPQRNRSKTIARPDGPRKVADNDVDWRRERSRHHDQDQYAVTPPYRTGDDASTINPEDSRSIFSSPGTVVSQWDGGVAETVLPDDSMTEVMVRRTQEAQQAMQNISEFGQNQEERGRQLINTIYLVRAGELYDVVRHNVAEIEKTATSTEEKMEEIDSQWEGLNKTRDKLKQTTGYEGLDDEHKAPDVGYEKLRKDLDPSVVHPAPPPVQAVVQTSISGGNSINQISRGLGKLVKWTLSIPDDPELKSYSRRQPPTTFPPPGQFFGKDVPQGKVSAANNQTRSTSRASSRTSSRRRQEAAGQLSHYSTGLSSASLRRVRATELASDYSGATLKGSSQAASSHVFKIPKPESVLSTETQWPAQSVLGNPQDRRYETSYAKDHAHQRPGPSNPARQIDARIVRPEGRKYVDNSDAQSAVTQSTLSMSSAGTRLATQSEIWLRSLKAGR